MRRALLLTAYISGAATALADPSLPAMTPPPKDVFEWARFLGPFHSVVLHYPIGFVTIAFILEGLTILRPCLEIRRAITIVMGFAAVSAVVAILFGFFQESAGGYEPRTMNLHKWLGVGVGALTVATYLVELFRKRLGAGQHWLWSYRALLAMTMLALVAAGHQGGNLTHGSDYLTKGAPQFMQKWWETSEPIALPAASLPADPDERYFVERIRPIFKAKCYSCHGPEKHKGDYRLDERASAFAGGESEEVAIKPGDPFGSSLVRLIMLPREDDEVMPPEGKDPLTAEEILAIVRWIQKGAAFVESQPSTAATPSPPAAESLEE